MEQNKKKGTITTIIFLLHHHHRQFSLVFVRSYHHLPHHLFNPHNQSLIPFNHHHHHHQDLIILLGIFIFQHNFHLQILVTEGKYCLETYLAHRQNPSPEKKNGKVVQDSVQQESDDAIYKLPDSSKLELGDGLLNSLGIEAVDILQRY